MNFSNTILSRYIRDTQIRLPPACKNRGYEEQHAHCLTERSNLEDWNEKLLYSLVSSVVLVVLVLLLLFTIIACAAQYHYMKQKRRRRRARDKAALHTMDRDGITQTAADFDGKAKTAFKLVSTAGTAKGPTKKNAEYEQIEFAKDGGYVRVPFLKNKDGTMIRLEQQPDGTVIYDEKAGVLTWQMLRHDGTAFVAHSGLEGKPGTKATGAGLKAGKIEKPKEFSFDMDKGEGTTHKGKGIAGKGEDATGGAVARTGDKIGAKYVDTGRADGIDGETGGIGGETGKDTEGKEATKGAEPKSFKDGRQTSEIKSGYGLAGMDKDRSVRADVRPRGEKKTGLFETMQKFIAREIAGISDSSGGSDEEGRGGEGGKGKKGKKGGTKKRAPGGYDGIEEMSLTGGIFGGGGKKDKSVYFRR